MWWVFPIFWFFVIFLFFFVFRFRSCGWSWRGRERRYGEDAGEILRRRFARGEIDEGEYKRLRDVLAQ